MKWSDVKIARYMVKETMQQFKKGESKNEKPGKQHRVEHKRQLSDFLRRGKRGKGSDESQKIT
jgi:hypothetical protein